jgi:uncharacterized membrane protein HdeD (DUF308 family)
VSLPFPAPAASAPEDERAGLRRVSWLLLTLGLASIVIGVLAMLAPHIATDKAVVFLGALLVAAGISEAIHAVLVRKLRGFAMHLLAAALYLLVGLFVLEDPDRTAGVLTLLLAASFFVGGVFRILFALIEHFPAWPWVLFNGVVDLLLGVLIWRGWPESSLWVIGLFVGIELFMHGWSWVALALSVRTATAAPPV